MALHQALRTVFAAVSVSLLLTGCDTFTESRQAGEIPIALSPMDTDACPMTMTVSGNQWQLNYLGLYVSNPEVRIDGRWQELNFKPNEWQTKKVALLKFHDLCKANEAGNDHLLLDASDKLMKLATNLRFTIGLPFDMNHAALTDQKSPLHDDEMFASRQSGHLFIRLELENTKSKHRFSYHQGSVGCTSASADQPPEAACQYTNRVEMILPTTQLDTELDLALSVPTMVAQVDLAGTQGCMLGSPEGEVCGQLLHNLLHRPWLDWQ